MVFRDEMEEEAEEQKFICKFCDKVCLSGRSLGGHMRGHLDLIAAAKKRKPEADQTSEDPEVGRKIFYSKHSGLKREDLCRESGKRHEEENHLCKKCGKVFDSIRAVYGHMQIHSKRSRLSLEESDMEENQCPAVRKKRSGIIRYEITENNSPFSYLEEEEAAVCLMMLSRGVTRWNGTLIFESQTIY